MTDTPTERAAESTWTRLRRRKVVQWGVVYVAAAWGFLQGLEYLSGTYDWPRQIQQLTTLALLIGLPIVLVLAYYHGDRGQQRITTPEFAILTLLLLLGGGAFWYYQRVSEANKDAAVSAKTAQPLSPAVSDARPSVAVLPFENRSREADDAFFVDGIHDDILTQLSKIGALKVISRTSVEQFRDTKLPIKDIAAQLGVKSILEGGVQRAGDRVRINVQLIEAESDAHLWADTYDRELTAANIFGIQSELATAIAGALKASLTASEKSRVNALPTRNLEAWEAYQLGKQATEKRTSAGLAEGERQFRRAIASDPMFAPAYAGLADAVGLQADYSGKPLDAAIAQSEAAVAKALELDRDLAEAWASRGRIAMARTRWDDAEKYLRRAIELSPNNATAHQWLSFTLRGENRTQEVLQHAERAVQLDPLSHIINLEYCEALQEAGRFDEAAARYERWMKFDPNSTPTLFGLASLYAYAQGQYTKAVPLQERAVALDTASPRLQSDLAMMLLDVDVELASQIIDAALARWPDEPGVTSVGAAIAAVQGDDATMAKRANRALSVYPDYSFMLAFLRNIDLRRGDPKAARARYASAVPQLFETTVPSLDTFTYRTAVDLALVLQFSGERDRALKLLDASDRFMKSIHRLGSQGFGIADVQIHALRGDRAKALSALREAADAGWRTWWRYHRDHDPTLASIRNEPEFKAIFADIERDMAQQRARLAARRKDAPLALGDKQ